ncbi:Potassium voltage-gated channel subfamily H member 8 [Fasciola hepatica]|uniref:Potassium voltage-gated channel subfamily H member 8 n=1 Tax=Fasciola hepatica TaxID=6192 RepID=A0A2H1BU07_FASHE|nr:Potassium voltage-gated channel subfamily H member 8 [Fasciola hepatica]
MSSQNDAQMENRLQSNNKVNRVSKFASNLLQLFHFHPAEQNRSTNNLAGSQNGPESQKVSATTTDVSRSSALSGKLLQYHSHNSHPHSPITSDSFNGDASSQYPWSTKDYSTIQDEAKEPNSGNYNFKRRKSIAFLNNVRFRKQSKQNTRKINQQIKNLSGKNVPEYKIQQFPKPNSLLLHYGIFRIVWDWILLTFTFYIAFMVPYYVTFGRRMGLNDTRKLIVDLVVEVFLIIDIMVNFNTTYVNTNGQLVHNRRQLAIHYIRSWFLIDALAAMPVDFTLVVVQTIWTSELDRTTDNSRGIMWSEQIDGLNETQLQINSTKRNSVPIWNVVISIESCI